MVRNGQLTFSDDPLLVGVNAAYQLIEEGDFASAVKKIDELLSINPEYPGLAEGYRTAKFWYNRQKEIARLERGKQTADFLMTQWEIFRSYSREKTLQNSSAYKSAMRYIFFTASENYKLAFQSQESTADNFELLLNLGLCFVTLGEYRQTVETLEYARSSYRSSARLLAVLAEAYYHTGEVPKSLLLFREAFSINPAEIELGLLRAKPIQEILVAVAEKKPSAADPREWVPVIGFIEDIFFVKRHLNMQQVEGIRREIYSLEKSFQTLGRERVENSNIVPRLLNKYLWMLDYFEFQQYNFERLSEIRTRLIQIDRGLFEDFFKKNRNDPKKPR